MLELLSSPEAWVALATLTSLEIVLGIDNIVFISILSGRLPEGQRAKARNLGLMVALVSRLLLLFAISWIKDLVDPLFTIYKHAYCGKDLVLIAGGLFLIAKSTHEMHNKLEGPPDPLKKSKVVSFVGVLVQIALLDLVFSLDSVITAVGMVDHIEIMVTAVIISVGFMLTFAKAVGDFVENHPTIKMLALSFLLLIGFTLVADGFGQHIPKGYIYFAMGFSVFVELINLRVIKKWQAGAPKSE